MAAFGLDAKDSKMISGVDSAMQSAASGYHPCPHHAHCLSSKAQLPPTKDIMQWKH